MSWVAMTVPDYQRRSCVVDGHRVHMSRMQTEFLALLLVRHPHHIAEPEALIEALWPNPDTQALTATNVISQLVLRLRKRGVPIETIWGRGYRITEEARQPDEPLRRAA
jgi:DNA-binding response OmpR family regulator